jgi:hypothetical protein
MTPEVMHALVRLMNNETDLEHLDNAALYALGSAARGGRLLLQRVITELNRRGETFEKIGEHYGVVESTASRWAKPTKGAASEVGGEE